MSSSEPGRSVAATTKTAWGSRAGGDSLEKGPRDRQEGGAPSRGPGRHKARIGVRTQGSSPGARGPLYRQSYYKINVKSVIHLT